MRHTVRPTRLHGWYSESPLQRPGEWYLEVYGNGYTGRGTLMSYWHRRAAELCGRSDYQASFGVERNDTDLGTRSDTTAAVRGTWDGARGRSTTTSRHLGSITKYSVAGVVQCPVAQMPAPPKPKGTSVDGCLSDGDCKPPRVCDNWSCTEPPPTTGCKDDRGCPGFQICEDRRCRDP